MSIGKFTNNRNCQVVGLGDLITAACPDIKVDAWEVWDKTPDQLTELAQLVSRSDYLISQPLLGPRYAAVVQASLSRHPSKPTLSIHNLYWGATAPDCKYVGLPRIPSPVMNYHSGRIVECFLAGKTVSTAAAEFDNFTKQEAMLAWKKNFDEFIRRESAVDIKFAEQLEFSVRTQKSFHVFNHPTIELLSLYATEILNALFPGLTIPTKNYNDRLEQLGAFPVYSSIAHNLNLPYRSPNFEVRTLKGLVSMEPQDFIERSYEIYGRYKKEYIIKA